MHLYYDQFSAKHDYEKITKAGKYLIIASTPRCGSHMLGHALQRTNKFGFPLEYANPVNIEEWKIRFKSDQFEEVMKKIIEVRTSPNSVFGIKIHYSHLKQFGGFNSLKGLFPNAFYIMLTRRNVLRQAISMSIAKQTGVWISGQTPTSNYHQYNYKDIDNCLREIILDNASWRYILAASGSQYLEMEYEEIKKDLIGSIKKIGAFMKVDIDDDAICAEMVTKKQGNRENIDYEFQFLRDYNGETLNVSRSDAKVIATSDGKKQFAKKIKKKLVNVIKK